jgi:hypothetical protein
VTGSCLLFPVLIEECNRLLSIRDDPLLKLPQLELHQGGRGLSPQILPNSCGILPYFKEKLCFDVETADFRNDEEVCPENFLNCLLNCVRSVKPALIATMEMGEVASGEEGHCLFDGTVLRYSTDVMSIFLLNTLQK